MQRGLVLRAWKGGDVGLRTQGSLSYDWEDFTGGRTNASGTQGKLGWTISGGGTFTSLAPVAGRPGISRLDTTATLNTEVDTTWEPLGHFVYGDTWDVLFIVRPNVIDANTKIRLGTVSAAQRSSDPPSDGCYFENLNETDWFAVSRASSTQTRTDTLAAATASTWYSLRVRRVNSSTIGFTVGSGTETLISTNVPTTTDATVWCQIVNTAAASKTIDIDYADCLITGLSR